MAIAHLTKEDRKRLHEHGHPEYWEVASYGDDVSITLECTKCGEVLLEIFGLEEDGDQPPQVVYGAPFPAKKCSGCEAGRKLLNAERELRRRLREWLEEERYVLAYRCAECVLAKLADLERELLEEK